MSAGGCMLRDVSSIFLREVRDKMQVTLYCADCVGNQKNCRYPRKVVVDSKEKLRAAVAFDHVCAEYRESYRSNQNFIEADVVVMDLDNDHTDDPAEWITPESLEDEYADLDYAIVFSRSHMKEKDGRSPRPRFHVYFRIVPFADPDGYSALKHLIYQNYPFFDGNALDAGRFIFGCSPPDVFWHEGRTTIDEVISEPKPPSSIPEGRRNATLSRTAGRIVKRYGVNEQSYQMFRQQAERCDPPLEESELATIWKSAGRFARKVQSAPGYVSPEAYEEASLKPDDYSDLGQAKVVAMDCGNELIYTPGTDFLVFSGSYWVESRQKPVGLMEDFLDRQLADAEAQAQRAIADLVGKGVSEKLVRAGGKALENQIGSDQMDAFKAFLSAMAYRSFVMKRRDYKYIVSALAAVRPMVEVDQNTLDADENLLNCPDGTYDLRKGLDGRRDHDSSDLITKITIYAPGPEGEDLWMQTLHTVFCDDQDLIQYVQEITGLCAIGAVYQEALIIAYGDGSNGKSTFWNTVAGALGNYSGTISADALTVGCKRNVRPELAEVKGKRLLIAAELEEGTRLSTSIVKQLCSTDEISAEKKYRDPFKFRPSHTLVLYTNHLPRVGAMDAGIWRRLIVIPFNAKIRGKTDIKNYSKYLLDHAGPAVVRWIIEGARMAIENRYSPVPPRCVVDAIESYRQDNDWLSHFLSECCEEEPSLQERSGDLYTEYRAFCSRSGEYARSTTEFYSSLEQRGFKRRKTKTGVVVYGLRLRQE